MFTDCHWLIKNVVAGGHGCIVHVSLKQKQTCLENGSFESETNLTIPSIHQLSCSLTVTDDDITSKSPVQTVCCFEVKI